MKRNNVPNNQTPKPASAPQTTPTAGLDQGKIDFAPSADEVARRAYFCYVNEGSRQGQDVQHWLTAEADLIAERNLTRIHGFHNRT